MLYTLLHGEQFGLIMPRRKQDKPQHLDEAEMTQENEALTNKALGGETNDLELEREHKYDSTSICDDKKKYEDSFVVKDHLGEQQNEAAVTTDDDDQQNTTSAANISVSEWMQVKSALQTLQQQQQILQLQIMQALMSGGNNKPYQLNLYQQDAGEESACSPESEQRNDQMSVEPDPQIGNDDDEQVERSSPCNSAAEEEDWQQSNEGGNPRELEIDDEPPAYECSNCMTGLPTVAALDSHMMEMHSSITNGSHSIMTNGVALPGEDVQKSAANSTNDLDMMESMEEYMEIQKPETSQLEHLVKNLDKTVTDPNQCVVCKRILSCKSALQMHYRTHTGERPFKCKLCCRAFTTKGNLKTHMGVHRAKPPLRLLHTCPVCSKQFTNALVLNQHMRLHTDGSTRKTALEMSGSHSESMNTNRRRSEEEDNPSTENLPDVADQNVSTLAPPPGIPFLFGGVPIQDSLRYADVLARQWDHMNRLSLLSPMTPTGVFSPALAGFQAAMVNNPFMAQASRTNRVYDLSRGGNLTSEQTSPSEKLDDIVDTNLVQVDAPDRNESNDQSEDRKKRLSHHSPSARSERSSVSNDASESSLKLEPPPGTTCDLCIKTFACRSALEIHYRSHTKQRPFKCDLCDKAFTTRGNMKQHILTHKSEELQWNVAEKTANDFITNRDSFLDDASRKNNNRHQCSVCSKHFSSASALQIHFRTHTGDRPFKCSVCGKAFTTKGNLKVHMGTHMWSSSPSRRGRRLSLDSPSENQHQPNRQITSPTSIPALNNNTMNWTGVNSAAFMKASLLGSQTALLAASYPNIIGANRQHREDNSKLWMWQVTCHVCNKECQSPAALQLHIKTHIVSENTTTKAVTA